ncbi:MAG: hypothetical protein WCW01_06455 [Gammaproteobacteria bacterium]
MLITLQNFFTAYEEYLRSEISTFPISALKKIKTPGLLSHCFNPALPPETASLLYELLNSDLEYLKKNPEIALKALSKEDSTKAFCENLRAILAEKAKEIPKQKEAIQAAILLPPTVSDPSTSAKTLQRSPKPHRINKPEQLETKITSQNKYELLAPVFILLALIPITYILCRCPSLLALLGVGGAISQKYSANNSSLLFNSTQNQSSSFAEKLYFLPTPTNYRLNVRVNSQDAYLSQSSLATETNYQKLLLENPELTANVNFQPVALDCRRLGKCFLDCRKIEPLAIEECLRLLPSNCTAVFTASPQNQKELERTAPNCWNLLYLERGDNLASVEKRDGKFIYPDDDQIACLAGLLKNMHEHGIIPTKRFLEVAKAEVNSPGNTL